MMSVAAKDKASWTDEQRTAIETRDVSVSLSAGAGCGKTFVLTNRYLEYFQPGHDSALQPEDLHQLVAITFTERAAREMRDRIRSACYQKLLMADRESAEHWSAMVRWLDNIRVTTIHSFCASLLRTHAVEAGLDPEFEVLEQAQSETLLSEVIDDHLRRLVAQGDPATIELATRFDLHGLRDTLRVLVLEAHGEEMNKWLATETTEQAAAWEAFFRERVVPTVARRVAQSPAATELLAILREHVPDHPKMRARCEVLLELVPSLEQAAGDPLQLAAALGTIRENARVQGGGSAKAWDSAEAYATFQQAATELRKTIDGIGSLLSFDAAAAVEHAETGRRLLAIAAGVRERYEARKREMAALDFDDLLVRTRALLVDPAHERLRRGLSSQIRLLLVDEFQDTDRVQVELVKALCGDALGSGKLFFVGDYKQSIYRFRGADPDVFRELRDATPEAGRLALTENFRSHPAILHFVNALFWYDLGPEYEALHAHKPQVTSTPAVEFLWAVVPPGTQKEVVGSMRRREADWIARRIRAMLDGREALVCASDGDTSHKLQPRAVEPGDIAILFRALSDVQLYEEALRRHGIDYYLVGGHAFYAQQEIFDLLNLLRAIESPSDEVSLAGALRSGMFALCDETLFWLAQHPEGLAAGLFAPEPPSQLADDQNQRVAYAAQVLTLLRSNKDRLRICELIERAMSLTGYDATLLAEFLGHRKLANLRKVIEQARSFEGGGSFGLTDFIAELAEYVAQQPKEPLAATFSEDTNVVRLMTIHQAKGLEFPVVFIPDLDRAAVHHAQRVHFDERLGPLVPASNSGADTSFAGGYELWRFIEQEEELAELYRLLYVATTRAADYLVLSSGVTHAGDARGTWMQLLARRFDLLSGAVRGPLPSDTPHPGIKVTTDEPSIGRSVATRQSKGSIGKILAELQQPRGASPALPAVDPVAVDVRARRQYSFSRLTGHLERHVELTDGDSGAEPAVDPRSLGTLVHAVLAAIDFAQPDAWRELVELHAERSGSATESEVDETVRLVERFLKSPRARGLATARQSLAEAEFLLAWPIDATDDAPLLLTGYIDRLYQDGEGRWHVLDFKTNRVTGANMAGVAAGYEMQMLVYALATEQILGVPPATVALHFLRVGKEHPFTWDDTARRRAIELVEAGIAAATTAPRIA